METIMKKCKLIVICAFIFSLGACNYLDVVPDNIATIDYAFRNRTAAERYLYTCYSYRPQVGDIANDPAMASDETWQRYSVQQTWPTFPNTRIARGQQSITDPWLNFWDGRQSGRALWVGIRDCNIFLENIDKVTDLQFSEKERWIAEVKFLKAYYHYYLFKCYGPIPIVDENIPVSASVDEVKLERESVDKVVKYIVDLIDTACLKLPNADGVIQGSEAGRVDKLIALSIKAEVLLFAASPLFNGNSTYATEKLKHSSGEYLFPQTYSLEKWKTAAEACKEAIDICHAQGKALYDVVDPLVAAANDTFKLQTTYRQAICDRWNNELIWGNTNNDCGRLAQHSTPRLMRMNAVLDNNTAEWAPTLKLVEKYYSSNGVPINEDKEWQSKGWYNDRFKIRNDPSHGAEKFYVKEGEITVNLHYNREPRFYASIGFDKGIYFGLGYTNFPSNVRHCDFLNLQVSGFQGGTAHSATGYAAKKMNCFKNSQTATSTSWEYFPFPIMRLANLYLMYAEALNQADNSATNRAEAIYYLDLIRDRAGLDGVIDSWNNHSTQPTKPSTQAGLDEIIKYERTIELALEGKRFWDIRRWNQIEELNNQPMGWNIIGQTPEDFYKVMPMAQSPLRFTVKDYFWPIREANININDKLAQSYGW